MNNGNSDPIIGGSLMVIGGPYKFYEIKRKKEYDQQTTIAKTLLN